eukprot:TRINITY_DN61942_c0_g1_i1.p1 TRINITY_DN61942_c0_g1~~TRINITY_DN61942_c0_g1_i1.p1  ORF type:complete len:152 (-),score=25.59 TRINITY_DN61942_c0_g1_i1:100-489(-)
MMAAKSLLAALLLVTQAAAESIAAGLDEDMDDEDAMADQDDMYQAYASGAGYGPKPNMYGGYYAHHCDIQPYTAWCIHHPAHPANNPWSAHHCAYRPYSSWCKSQAMYHQHHCFANPYSPWCMNHHYAR